MIIRPPNQCDWERFSFLASSEKWRVPSSELQRFKGPWSHCAYVLDHNGFCGLVTSVAYEKSAWIGNLIIPRNLRKKGYGTHLFRFVLADLVGLGITSIWLTASEQGRSIYEREGFVAVDFIERWELPLSGRAVSSPEESNDFCELLLLSDRLAWGEMRHPLLPVLCKDGQVFAVEDAVAMLQPGPDVQVVGPWYSKAASADENRELLEKIMIAADPCIDLVMDVFGSSPLQRLCKTSGFICTGQASLMVYGNIDSINLKSMMSMASLGSVG